MILPALSLSASSKRVERGAGWAWGSSAVIGTWGCTRAAAQSVTKDRARVSVKGGHVKGASVKAGCATEACDTRGGFTTALPQKCQFPQPRR
jgi:hypothetical protein